MSRQESKIWNVQFVGDYFALTTCRSASSEEEAISKSTAFLQEHYGWDMELCANEIEAQPAD